MREMKDSGVAWIGEIPEEWEILNLKTVAYIQTGSTPAKSEQNIYYSNEDGIPWIKAENLGSFSPISKTKEYLTKEGELEGRIFPENTVFICCIASVGKVGYSQIKCSCNQQINGLVFNSNMFWKYGFYLSVSQEELYSVYASGNVMKIINSERQSRLLCTVPPLNEQQTIATYLDQKCTQIDALITNQQKQIEKLKAYKQSLITETVTKGLNPDVPMKDSGVEWIGEIPEDWEIVRIKNICQFNPSSKKSFSDDDIVSYAPMECVRTGSLVHKEIAIKNVSSGLTYFEENDIIMAKVTPCFENGNIAIATGLTKGMAFGSSELFVFRANESIKFFLFYFLQNNIFKKFSISTMTGTGGLKRVSSNFVNNYSFALPPIEERNKIVFYLDKKCTQIDSLIAIKQKKIEKLQQYKKSVIYEYVTGKKEVK